MPQTLCPPSSLVQLAPVFSFGSTVILGLIAAYIAWRQMVTARTKLRLDLYEKRATVYRACADMVSTIGAKGGVTPAELRVFSKAIEETAFLFDENVERYVDGLHDIALFATHTPAIWRTDNASPANTAEVVNWSQEMLGWLRVEAKKAGALFRPYLQIDRPFWTRRKTIRVSHYPALNQSAPRRARAAPGTL